MPARSAQQSLPLPRGWTKTVNSAVLHALSLAATALTAAWSSAATSRSSRHGEHAELDRLRGEIAQLTEELEIKDARWARVPARRRPYYGPVQRMRILQLRAARGWSARQTADRFLVTEETITSWIRRLDEGGERALVQIDEPVNKFPDFVVYLVRHLKVLCPCGSRKPCFAHSGVSRRAPMTPRCPTSPCSGTCSRSIYSSEPAGKRRRRRHGTHRAARVTPRSRLRRPWR